MSIQTLVFEPMHLLACEFDEFHEANIVMEDVAAMAMNDPAVTMLCNNEIVGIIGYVRITDVDIKVYVIPTIHLPKYRFSVVKRLRHILKTLLERYDRIITISYADGKNDKWMQCLGFSKDGLPFTFGQLEYEVWSQVKQV